jgi:hypothetical protein
MSGPSFRSSFVQVVSRSAALGAGCLLALVALAGCGGGSRAPQTVQGDGYGFAAPAGWTVARTGTTVAATHGSETVGVTTFRLTKTYRPQLWKQAVTELDAVAAKLASELHGTVTASRTLKVGPSAARQYDLAFTKDGERLVEQITFVLRGRREYELLCRYKAGRDEPACSQLLTSFQPV